MNKVDYERILTKRHHYWRNLLIVLIVAIVIGSVWHVQSVPTEDERTVMNEFIQESLREKYQPASLQVREMLNSERQTVYIATWTSEDTLFYTYLEYEGSIDPNMAISLSQPKITNIDLNTFYSVARRFFKNIKLTEGNWECHKTNNIDVCEISWLNGKDKISAGIYNLAVRNTSSLYTCKIPFGSNNYDQDTCITVR